MRHDLRGLKIGDIVEVKSDCSIPTYFRWEQGVVTKFLDDFSVIFINIDGVGNKAVFGKHWKLKQRPESGFAKFIKRT